LETPLKTKPVPLPMSGNLKRYLSDEPLTEELAEIRAGVSLPPVDLTLKIESGDTRQVRPLVRAEKAALREFRQSDAWPALDQLLKNTIQNRINAATILSQDDPLTKKDALANHWAYIAIYREVWRDLVEGVEKASREVEGTDESGVD